VMGCRMGFFLSKLPPNIFYFFNHVFLFSLPVVAIKAPCSLSRCKRVKECVQSCVGQKVAQSSRAVLEIALVER
jgi:hypothetical protein